MPEPTYFGRVQQGTELVLALQCTNVDGEPEDPASPPYVQVALDAATPTWITSRRMPSHLRRVEDGVFRLPLFLDTLYSTTGRYLVIFKWLDSDGVAHTKAGSFHLMPGGDGDGAVIAISAIGRPDAAYLLTQCDSGRLVRKRNPR